VKVILIQSIDRLGKIGDIVNVKEGYARNYLLPKNVAKEATPGNMKMLDFRRPRDWMRRRCSRK
jgi:large subunit ribosomal protein L9